MGTRSLELTLRRRLLAVLAPALVGVAIATVGSVWVALARADENAARDRASAALRILHGELLEGDAPKTALDEVIHSVDADGVRIWLRSGAITATNARDRASVTGAGGPGAGLARGECRSFRDSGVGWVACAVGDGDEEAVTAVSTEAHDQVVHAVAAGASLAVAFALLVAILAMRAALRAPLASLDALVTWSEKLVRDEKPTDAPSSDAIAEIVRLTTAFDALVRRLFDALERERASSAHIAHELRTPLTAMRAELEALAQREPSARRLIDDVERLSRAIDAILVLSQRRAPEPTSAVVNVADVARALTPSTAKLDAPDEALVHGDEQLITLALRNVLENADKYGDGATQVTVRREGERVEVVVCDEGDGLDAEACAHMFERHWRASKVKAGGTGLGLALVEAVAERHGGAAVAGPNPAGRGLEVRVGFGALVGWHD